MFLEILKFKDKELVEIRAHIDSLFILKLLEVFQHVHRIKHKIVVSFSSFSPNIIGIPKHKL